MGSTIYDALGTKTVINAKGIYTDLGGSILSPRVWAAVEDANRSFADLVALLDATGASIAEQLGAEAARVTPGASAAIMLGIAACMTGTDGTRMEQLPDSTGMPDEVLIQKPHRYKYDRMVRMTGARLVEVGDAAGSSEAQLADAIGPNTAAVFVPAHLDGRGGTVSLPTVAAIAHERGVPVFVDAAYMNYPTNLMGSFTTVGADLVCFSAKYFGGPNAGGFVAGRRDLVDAVAGIDFTRFESGDHLIFGRPFKLDRQTVVAVTVALDEWLSMDHDARFRGYARKVEVMRLGLDGMRGITATPMHFTMEESLEPSPVNCLVVRVDGASELTAAEIDARLRADNPAILVHLRDDALIIDVEVMRDGDEDLIVDRLRDVLSAPRRELAPAVAL
jgi:L-seryl-tRNA(Ser) seleniumtransferase